MTYYEEIIADLMEDGYSEEDAISKLGSIQETVANVKGNEEIIEIKKMKTTTSAWVSILLILGFPLWGSLMAAWLCLLLAAYILIWCVPIITVALGLAGSMSFIVGIFGSFCTVYRIRLFRNYTIRCERNIWSCWTYWDRPNLSSIRNNSCIF